MDYNEKDEYPILSEEGLNKFFNKSFDPDLGWTRRPNSQGIEKGKFGDVKYNIDWLGSREISLVKNMIQLLLAMVIPMRFADKYMILRLGSII